MCCLKIPPSPVQTRGVCHPRSPGPFPRAVALDWEQRKWNIISRNICTNWKRVHVNSLSGISYWLTLSCQSVAGHETPSAAFLTPETERKALIFLPYLDSFCFVWCSDFFPEMTMQEGTGFKLDQFDQYCKGNLNADTFFLLSWGSARRLWQISSMREELIKWQWWLICTTKSSLKDILLVGSQGFQPKHSLYTSQMSAMPGTVT